MFFFGRAKGICSEKCVTDINPSTTVLHKHHSPLFFLPERKTHYPVEFLDFVKDLQTEVWLCLRSHDSGYLSACPERVLWALVTEAQPMWSCMPPDK